MADSDTGAPPKVLLITAAGLVVALAVAVAVFALVRGKATSDAAPPDANGPLALVAVPAPHADEQPCTTLVSALPASLTSNGEQLARRALAAPSPKATVAWGGGDAVVLRCGLDRPPELTQTAQLRVVNGVQWLQLSEDGSATWYVVDRDVYLALTIPDTAGTGPLQAISDTVAAKLPVKPLKF
ncbi:DUF3515 domain-containing protein [Amycolatopsis sp. PS_44_ISF1]|uniref:DUF3515 domain-containing protein n=1 Tax=Amycolatopsis sp. PS_44_ISF1 TaxID=2974917 RepID=UPI0028E06709|nr:DUF3515 domain-containing protein [Amycolatopsis sp. PS_44_ISF1]MDT8915626.1 DUF3515 domain-containing protein [Amycolatopsis sp. PS_44_ISF1]